MRDKKDSQKKEESNEEPLELKTLLGESLKKVFAAGVTAAFMTEESVRSHLAELKLPKEILNLIIQQANKSKDELVAKVGKEVMLMLSKIDMVSELAKFAETHKFKINAEIEVIKKDQGTHPSQSQAQSQSQSQSQST